MKIILATVLLLIPWIANATATRTVFCVQNLTAISYNLSAVDIENYDWQDLFDDGAMNRPDHRFNNYALNAGDTHCVTLDYNYESNPHFGIQALPASQDAYGSSSVKTRFFRGISGWEIDERSSHNGGYYGRLQGVGQGSTRSGYHCPDKDKMPDWTHCNLFKITH